MIGIIDASGSMNGCWSWLVEHWNSYIDKSKSMTIVFDTIATIVESNILDPILEIHGGGGTNISKAFKLLEEQL